MASFANLSLLVARVRSRCSPSAKQPARRPFVVGISKEYALSLYLAYLVYLAHLARLVTHICQLPAVSWTLFSSFVASRNRKRKEKKRRGEEEEEEEGEHNFGPTFTRHPTLSRCLDSQLMSHSMQRSALDLEAFFSKTPLYSSPALSLDLPI